MNGVASAGLAGYGDLVLVHEWKCGRVLYRVIQATAVDQPFGVVQNLGVAVSVKIEGEHDEASTCPFDLVQIPLFLETVAAMREHDGGCRLVVGGGLGLEHVDAEPMAG